MTQKTKGTVTKAGKGKFSYFLLLDGNDFYYNTKFEPKCGEGDVVGIEFEKKGDSRGNIKRVAILTDNSGGYQKSNSERKEDDWGGNKSSGGGGSKGGSTGNDARQQSIVWQHSQEMAISAATALLSNEAFTLGAKAPARQEQILALIDELTVKFYKDAMAPAKSKAMSDAKDLGDDMGEDEKDEDDDSDDEWD